MPFVRVYVAKYSYIATRYAATHTVAHIQEMLEGKDRIDIALTGGTDGIEMLASPAFRSNLVNKVDLRRVHFWWGDERFVAADSPDRNAVQARKALLDGLIRSGKLPESNIHEMPADTRTPEQIASATDEENDAILADAARAYQEELERELGPDGALNIAIFGVGGDGHFASLFPEHPEVELNDPAVKVVGVNHSPKLPPMRVSLTVPFIQQSKRVLVVATGPQKTDAVSRALSRFDNPAVPSSFAHGVDQTIWYTDNQSSSDIDQRNRYVSLKYLPAMC